MLEYPFGFSLLNFFGSLCVYLSSLFSSYQVKDVTAEVSKEWDIHAGKPSWLFPIKFLWQSVCLSLHFCTSFLF